MNTEPMIDLNQIKTEALQTIVTATDIPTLEEIRVCYLGKKGKLTEVLKSLGHLTPEERPKVGQQVNDVKEALQVAINEKRSALQAAALQAKLATETVDVTLPGNGQSVGALHPVSRSLQRITDFFTRLGFNVAEGPEVEDDYHNFTALNIPEHHPARASHDTFYFDAN